VKTATIAEEEDDLTIMLYAAKRLLFSLFLHPASKFIFFFMAMICFTEWLRTSVFRAPIETHKSSTLSKSERRSAEKKLKHVSKKRKTKQ